MVKGPKHREIKSSKEVLEELLVFCLTELLTSYQLKSS